MTDRSPKILISKYRVLSTLGKGGFATTYLAENITSHEKVAIKALSLRQASDWKAITLFEREAEILAKIDHHAIPRYIEHFHIDTDKDRTFYIVQQLAAGKSLAQLVEDGWHTDQAEVENIAVQILEILVYLQDFNPPIIHRDIKPENIIRNDSGQVFLVDFGAVQNTYYSTMMRGSTIVGTYGYMAPEQFDGKAQPATDLYGLGATLLFLLTHRSPADLPQDGLSIDFKHRIQVSDFFAAWLEKMLEPDIIDRYSSAKNALTALKQKRFPFKRPSKKQLIGKLQLLSAGVLLVGAALCGIVINSYSWAIFNKLGFRANESICKNPRAIRYYVETGGDIHTDLDGLHFHSLLECTAAYADEELTLQLINEGVEINNTSTGGSSALYFAAKPLKFFPSPEFRSDEDKAKFAKRRIKVAEILLAKGANIEASVLQNNCSLLQMVMEENWTDMAKVLINSGSNVNANSSCSDMMPPLHYATMYRNQELVDILIEKGVETNSKESKYGFSAIHAMLTQDTLMENYGISDVYLVQPSFEIDKEIIQTLIENGADASLQDISGKTPSSLAEQTGNLRLSEFIDRYDAQNQKI
jgi:ankyrin repeat protein